MAKLTDDVQIRPSSLPEIYFQLHADKSSWYTTSALWWLPKATDMNEKIVSKGMLVMTLGCLENEGKSTVIKFWFLLL